MKFLPPFGLALLRPRINQIEAHAFEMFGSDLKRGARLFGAMQTSQKSELLIRKGLHAERNAIDACRSIACKARRFDARRIGFEGDLALRIDRPQGRRFGRGDRPPTRRS